MQDDLVRQSYDRIAEAYSAQRSRFSGIEYLERLIALLPPSATVLDLGGGAAMPIDRYLLDKGFRVLGLDISSKQIELARANNPDARYEIKDMRTLQPGDYEVDAIVSFYAIFHLPRDKHAALFEVLRAYLPPNGPLLVTMGATDWESIDQDFHGATMFWSHFDAATNRKMIEGAGFEILLDEIDESVGERHQIILARAASA